VDLIPELLNVSRANATVKTYHLGFIRWKKWASITKNGFAGKISTLDIPLIEAHFFQRINPKWYVFTVAFALDTFSNSGIRSTDPAEDAGNFCD
jgi:hypothetical protein